MTGMRISLARFVVMFCSTPEEMGFKFARVQSGKRTIRGISTIKTSFST